MSKTALDMWEHLVCEAPEKVALFFPCGRRRVSRKSLDDKSDQLCREWKGSGLKAHQLLALNIPNGVDWMAAYIACLKLKIVAVPLDPGLEESEIASLSKGLGIQALWDGSSLKLQAGIKPLRLRNPAIVTGKLSSGSTGLPKLIFFSADEMLADGLNIIRAMGIRGTDINLGMIPWGHSYGLGNIVYPLLIQGTMSTWVNSVFPSDIIDTCSRVKATLFPAVPTLLKALAWSDCNEKGLSSLRLVISAGARLRPEIAQKYRDCFGIVPRNFYGSTETGGICFDESGEAGLSGRSVGKPLNGVDIQESRGRRFYVQSNAVFKHGNRHAHEGSIAKHLTGDYGTIDSRGELVLENRAKGIIKIAGRRINPADVESRLESISGVSQVVVFGLDINQDTFLAAAFETTLSRGELLQEIRTKIPIRLRPKKFICFEMFPVTRRGKVNLSQIKRSF